MKSSGFRLKLKLSPKETLLANQKSVFALFWSRSEMEIERKMGVFSLERERERERAGKCQFFQKNLFKVKKHVSYPTSLYRQRNFIPYLPL